MKIPPTQRLANEFDARNVVLQLALGGLAWGRKLDALLERWAPAADDGEHASEQAGDDPGVDFVLGLIAFRRQLERRVAVPEPDPTAPDEAAGGPRIEPRELLR